MYLQVKSFGDIDRETITGKNIRFAYRLRLPFRLRTGKLFRIRSTKEQTIEICFHNDILIQGKTTIEHLREFEKDIKRIWTQALLIIEKPKISQDEIEQLRQGNHFPESLHYHDQALKALNEIVIAYHTVNREMPPGNRLHELNLTDFYRFGEHILVILCPEEYWLSDKDIVDLFDLQPKFVRGGMAVYRGELQDLEKEKLDRIPAALALQQNYIFYEFAFLAESRMEAQDYNVALLMAVVALEAAHSVFVRLVLQNRTKGKVKREENLINDFLREQGFYVLNQMTPLLLMEEDERPSPETLEACSKGVQMRNAIMHALRDKSGYKIQKYTHSQLYEAYKAVMQVYENYVQAIEKRLS